MRERSHNPQTTLGELYDGMTRREMREKRKYDNKVS